MAKFYFDVDDGIVQAQDTIGHSFANRHVASEEATGLLADIARDAAIKNKCNDIKVDMRDRTGRIVFTATLSILAKWVGPTAAPHLKQAMRAELQMSGTGLPN